jgi:hypothetical protein
MIPKMANRPKAKPNSSFTLSRRKQSVKTVTLMAM